MDISFTTKNSSMIILCTAKLVEQIKNKNK